MRASLGGLLSGFTKTIGHREARLAVAAERFRPERPGQRNGMGEITRQQLMLALIQAGERPRLAGLDLSGLKLATLNLSKADLKGADMSGASLEWADLGGPTCEARISAGPT